MRWRPEVFRNVSPVERPWHFWLSQLSGAWKPISLITALLTLFGLFGSFGWLLDLCGIFRAQYAILLFAGTVIFLPARKWTLCAISAIALATNLLLIVPLYIPQKANVQRGDNLRILVMNVNSRNREFQRVLAAIHDLSPDLICIEEVDADWERELRQNLPLYRHFAIQARPDNFGIAVFSRMPMESRIEYFGSARVPSVVATVHDGSRSFVLVSTHPLPPRALDYFLYRNDELAQIGRFLAQLSTPLVLAGDLNTPAWSPYFQKLCADAHLIDSEQGFGLQPTWPTNTSLFWIPIDHLLYRGNFRVVKRSTYPYVGSDHFPLCVDLVLSD